MFDWATINAWANCVLAFTLIVLQIVLYRRYKTARIIRIMFLGVGVYWFLLYLYVSIVEPGSEAAFNPVFFGQIFVRPAFTLTLLTMVSAALYRFRSQ